MTTPRIDAMGGRDYCAGTTAGHISQNVYLYAAATNLATVALMWVDREKLATKMGLNSTEHILLTQSVGYPEK